MDELEMYLYVGSLEEEYDCAIFYEDCDEQLREELGEEYYDD